MSFLRVSSFLIVRHPSPPIATHSAANKNPVTAKIHCRLLCLLDKTDFPMTIENTSINSKQIIRFFFNTIGIFSTFCTSH